MYSNFLAQCEIVKRPNCYFDGNRCYFDRNLTEKLTELLVIEFWGDLDPSFKQKLFSALAASLSGSKVLRFELIL